LGHLLIEYRYGLIANAMATHVDGTAEREAGTILVDAHDRTSGDRCTIGFDKTYDTAEFVHWMRVLRTTLPVIQRLARHGGSAMDGRTTRHLISKGMPKVSLYVLKGRGRPRLVGTASALLRKVNSAVSPTSTESLRSPARSIPCPATEIAAEGRMTRCDSFGYPLQK
jgi:hypothetical protein